MLKPEKRPYKFKIWCDYTSYKEVQEIKKFNEMSKKSYEKKNQLYILEFNDYWITIKSREEATNKFKKFISLYKKWKQTIEDYNNYWRKEFNSSVPNEILTSGKIETKEFEKGYNLRQKSINAYEELYNEYERLKSKNE